MCYACYYVVSCKVLTLPHCGYELNTIFIQRSEHMSQPAVTHVLQFSGFDQVEINLILEQLRLYPERISELRAAILSVVRKPTMTQEQGSLLWGNRFFLPLSTEDIFAVSYDAQQRERLADVPVNLLGASLDCSAIPDTILCSGGITLERIRNVLSRLRRVDDKSSAGLRLAVVDSLYTWLDTLQDLVVPLCWQVVRLTPSKQPPSKASSDMPDACQLLMALVMCHQRGLPMARTDNFIYGTYGPLSEGGTKGVVGFIINDGGLRFTHMVKAT